MAKSTVKATDLAARLTSLAASELMDVSVGKLVFTSEKKGLSTGVGDVLQDGLVEESTGAAMALNLTLLDNDFEALNSGVFGHRVTATVDGIPFRLTKVSIVEDFKMTALLEHALIAEMREHSKPMKASRHSMTRAEFVASMLKELRTPYTFICPELGRKQPVAKKKISKKQRLEEEGVVPLSASNRNAAVKHPGLKVKGQPMTPAQAVILTEALNAAEGVGGAQRAMEALVVAIIQESDVANLAGGDKDSEGALQVRLSTARGIAAQDGTGTLDPKNVGEVSVHFIVAGYYGKGGANALATAHPSWTVGHIAQEVQGSAFPTAYDQWGAEGKAIVAEYLGGNLGSFGGEGATASNTYSIKTTTFEYERGQPGQTEDTFTCAQRLANEVGWSFFVVGQRSIYLVNDDDLLKALPRYKIGPTSKGLVDFKGDVEVGHRTVVIHGKRQPKPSLAELIVRIDRWAAPAGTVILISGYGPFDGKWLVDGIERSLYDDEATIHLRAPAKPLEEPPWEVSTVTLSGGGSSGTGSAGGEAVVGVPSGVPAPASGQYRNPPAQGPKGTGSFEGITVARWIIPALQYARKHGWTGSPTSGYRPGPDPHTVTGASEHQGTQYPHGAVDFGGYGAFAERAAFFAHMAGYTGLPIIPAQFPGDGGHASGTGH